MLKTHSSSWTEQRSAGAEQGNYGLIFIAYINNIIEKKKYIWVCVCVSVFLCQGQSTLFCLHLCKIPFWFEELRWRRPGTITRSGWGLRTAGASAGTGAETGAGAGTEEEAVTRGKKDVMDNGSTAYSFYNCYRFDLFIIHKLQNISLLNFAR